MNIRTGAIQTKKMSHINNKNFCFLLQNVLLIGKRESEIKNEEMLELVTWAVLHPLVDGLLYSRYSDVGETVRRGVIAKSVDEISSRVFSRALDLSLRRSKTSFREGGDDKVGLTFQSLTSLTRSVSDVDDLHLIGS